MRDLALCEFPHSLPAFSTEELANRINSAARVTERQRLLLGLCCLELRKRFDTHREWGRFRLVNLPALSEWYFRKCVDLAKEFTCEAASGLTPEEWLVKRHEEQQAEARRVVELAEQAEEEAATLDEIDGEECQSPDLGVIDASTGDPTPVVERDAHSAVKRMVLELESLQAKVGAHVAKLNAMRDLAEGNERQWICDICGIYEDVNNKLVELQERVL